MYGSNLATIPPGVNGQACLEALRSRVAGSDGPKPGSVEDGRPYLRSDHMLVRFLIARQWDVERATCMIREHYRFLEKKNLEVLLQQPFPEEPFIKKFYPQSYHGTDKQGRPLYIERPGKIDMPRLLQHVKPERLVDYFGVESEKQVRRRLPACSLARGEVVDKSLNIVDLEGLSLSLISHSTARKVVTEITKTQQSQYPEMMGKLVILNAPWAFKSAWSFVKGMLDEKTLSKVSIYGSDKEAYSQALLELVDASQLPALYGGTCRCDGQDPASCMMHVKGPWVEPDIVKILDSQPLEYLMTPEGSKLLRCPEIRPAPAEAANAEQPAEASIAEQPAEAASAEQPAETANAAEPAEAANAQPAEGYSSPVAEIVVPAADAERQGEVTADTGEQIENSDEEEMLDKVVQLKTLPPSLNMEFERIRQQVSELAAKHKVLEAESIKTVEDWVEESNQLVTSIGRYAIERAQRHYDLKAVCNKIVEEFFRQQEDASGLARSHEEAVRNLRRAECALEAFLTGDGEDMSEEAWEGLVSEDHLPDSSEIPELRAEPKLVRMYRVSVLSDRVSRLRRQLDAAAAQAKVKAEELAEAQRAFEQENDLHRSCGSNCSVKRAAAYFERCKAQDAKIADDNARLQALEQQLHMCRRRSVELQMADDSPSKDSGDVRCSLSAKYGRLRKFDEMSLKSFELAGAEPSEVDFLSCASGNSS